MGPYLIRVACIHLGLCLLEELDGTELSRVYAGDRLKKFFQREGIEPEDEEVYEEEDNDDNASKESVDEDYCHWHWHVHVSRSLGVSRNLGVKYVCRS